MNQYKINRISQTCISLAFGDEISTETSNVVLDIYTKLKSYGIGTKLLSNVVDVVPSYTELALHCNCVITPFIQSELIDAVNDITASDIPWWKKLFGKKTVVIPVKYDGEDLDRIASLTNLSVEEIINIHAGTTYTVAMVGFKPHFPYLIGMDKRLEVPRLESPRKKVPEGAVAIGGQQTGIYPVSSPGGWNLIGSTDPKYLEKISAGDSVKFKVVA